MLALVLLACLTESLATAVGSTGQVVLKADNVNVGSNLLPSIATTTYLPGGIPRLIHQVFLSGNEALRREETALHSKFRRDWRLSCQVHNPGWQYILWDQAMAEALLRERYPRSLRKFTSINTVVLRGDMIRPFILHAYGGVYMDMDTECFGPMDGALAVHGLVLQAEADARVNNAQMASTAGHPFWTLLHRRIHGHMSSPRWAEQDMTPREVLLFAGPTALSMALRKALRIDSEEPVAGKTFLYPGMLDARQASVHVAGLKRWFQACEWDRPGCRLLLARCAPVVRATLSASWRAARQLAARTNNSAVSLHESPLPITHAYAQLLLQVAAAHPAEVDTQRKAKHRRPHDAPPQLPPGLDPLECATIFGELVGAHHFSGSWIKPDFLITEQAPAHDKADEAQRVLQETNQGLVTFFTLPSLFLETEGSTLAQSRGATIPVTASFEAVPTSADPSSAQPGPRCRVLSVIQVNHPMTGQACCGQDPLQAQSSALLDLARWAALHNCSVTTVTDASPAHPTMIALQQRGVQVHQQQLCIGTSCQQGSLKLNTILGRWRGQHDRASRLDLLHVSCPGNCTWAALQQLQTAGSAVLRALRPRVLLLDTGPLAAADLHLLLPAYQHLYQELGYVGYHHERPVGSSPTSSSAVNSFAGCTPCVEGPDVALPALRLGLTPLHLARTHRL